MYLLFKTLVNTNFSHNNFHGNTQTQITLHPKINQRKKMRNEFRVNTLSRKMANYSKIIIHIFTHHTNNYVILFSTLSYRTLQIYTQQYNSSFIIFNCSIIHLPKIAGRLTWALF